MPGGRSPWKFATNIGKVRMSARSRVQCAAMHRPNLTIAPAIFGLLCACANDPEQPASSTYTTASTAAGLSTSETDSGNGDEGEAYDDDGDSGGDGATSGDSVKLDVVGEPGSGGGMADDGGGEMGCSKVDLILAID